MTNELISKKDLLKRLRNLSVKNITDSNMIEVVEGIFDIVKNEINSAPVVKSIKHDAPSAPIEEKILSIHDIRAVYTEWQHARETVHGLYMRFKRAEQALLPSTQAKESEG